MIKFTEEFSFTNKTQYETFKSFKYTILLLKMSEKLQVSHLLYGYLTLHPTDKAGEGDCVCKKYLCKHLPHCVAPMQDSRLHSVSGAVNADV